MSSIGSRCLAVLGGIALVVMTSSIALANGGQIRIDQEQLGPYIVTVTTNPVPLRAGVIDVSVLVGDPLNGAYLENAEIKIVAESLDHQGVSSTQIASHDQAVDKRYQATEFVLPESGKWRFTITVNGPDGGGATAFEADAAGAEGFDWLPVAIFVLAVPAVIGLLWYLFHGRHGPDDEAPQFEEVSGAD